MLVAASKVSVCKVRSEGEMLKEKKKRKFKKSRCDSKSPIPELTSSNSPEPQIRFRVLLFRHSHLKLWSNVVSFKRK